VNYLEDKIAGKTNNVSPKGVTMTGRKMIVKEVIISQAICSLMPIILP
jgi:hypothetical protein